ncbi:MAG: hypothetical protein K6G40_07700 [Eubacterium sp.]|nr:hypothetical protein [Eubacterium sp.]
MNPMNLLQLKQCVDIFKKEHPKMIPFIKTIGKKGVSEGSVVEIKVVASDGKEYVSNIRMTKNDLHLLHLADQMGKK